MRCVGSMTTLPSRFEIIIEPLKAILRQSDPLDLMYLHIPKVTLKGKPYVIPDNFMENFDGLPTKLVINRCEKDYGPITKLAPIIDVEEDPDTYILTFDDDMMVHRNVVKKMKEKIRKIPDTCLAFSGICVGSFPFYYQGVLCNEEDQPVDWIQGVHVVAYKRSFFTTVEELVTYGDDTPIKHSLLFNDDHRTSSYLASKNIPRVAINHDIRENFFRLPGQSPDALSGRWFHLVCEHAKIISYFVHKGIYVHTFRVKYSVLIVPAFILFLLYWTAKWFTLSPQILAVLLVVYSFIIVKLTLSRIGLKTYSPIMVF